MGLALLVLVFRVLGVRSGKHEYFDLSRFWEKIFGINFAIGVVTGIPLELQFGTNWGRFSERSGVVIGLTLAMEGMFAFFAESAFLALFLYGEKKLGRRLHFFSGVMVFLGRADTLSSRRMRSCSIRLDMPWMRLVTSSSSM